MKKQKSTNFVIPLVVYPFDAMVSIGETNEQVDKHLAKYNLTSEDVKLATITSHTIQGRTVMFSSNQTLIRLKDYPITNRNWADLSHEIFHAVAFIMWKVGMELEIGKSDEAYAYLISYLSEEIYKRLE